MILDLDYAEIARRNIELGRDASELLKRPAFKAYMERTMNTLFSGFISADPEDAAGLQALCRQARQITELVRQLEEAVGIGSQSMDSLAEYEAEQEKKKE